MQVHGKGNMSDVVNRFALRIEPVDGFEFRVRFDKDTYPALRVDEPPPLGKDAGPNPARLLAAAVGNCLAASLLFCLRKAGASGVAVSADVHVELVRNERKRLRIGQVAVELRPKGAVGEAVLQRCLHDFEDFCIVTQSVRQGLDIRVAVLPEPSTGVGAEPGSPAVAREAVP
jgi:uncharacterized OsmC-like protein